MAIDLRGFTIPESNINGLYKVTGDIERRNAMQAQAERDARVKADASTKFITNYLSDKDKFTGTAYDPYTHELVAKSMNQAMDLINQGASDSDIVNAISPSVAKASQYVNSAQTYQANKKEQLANLKGQKGIDLQKVSDEMDKMAFGDKDISSVDPNQNYADMALRNGDVYNNEGFDEMKKNAKMLTNSAIVKNTDAHGRLSRTKVKTIAPEYAVSETDADGNHVGFAPKFDVATDGGNEIIHQFETEKGREKAPVRLLNEDVFNAMPTAAQAYVLQEAKKYAKLHNVDISSSQAKNFARAIAYDELKPRSNGSFETAEETKAPQIKIYNSNKGESKADQRAALTKNDLYTALDETQADSRGMVDITPLTGGIAYLKNSRGKQISQPSLRFNPADKTVTYKDPSTDLEETVSLSKFKSMAKSNNSKEDLDYLEYLRDYKRGGDKEPPPNKEAPKSSIPKNVFQKLKNWGLGASKTAETKTESSNKWDKYLTK